MNGQVQKLDREIKTEPNAEFGKKLEAERARLGQVLAGAQEALKKMGYTADKAPDLYEPAAMAALRKERDPAE